MALIKGAASGSMTHDVIVLDLGDLRKQADELLSRARASAQHIIVEAKAEAAQLRSGADKQGHAEGHETGHAEGLEVGRAQGHAQAMAEAKEQLDRLQQSWTAAIESWEADRREMMIDARQSLLELALAVAKKVVHRTPHVKPDAVVDQIHAAIDYVVRPGDITIRIHPDDRAFVAEALPAIVQAAGQVHHAELVDDASIGRGGCVIAYGKGTIDATLDGQLDRIIETMMPAQTGNKEVIS